MIRYYPTWVFGSTQCRFCESMH